LVKTSKAHLRQILKLVFETAELGIDSKLISGFFIGQLSLVRRQQVNHAMPADGGPLTTGC